MPGGIECRLLRTSDIDATVELMQRIGVHFAGVKSRRVLRAVAKDAANGSAHVRIALAVVDGVPHALVVAFVERAQYWRRFARRHPLEAVELASHRAVRTLRRRLVRGRARAAGVTPAAADARRLVADRIVPAHAENWTDETPTIAKVMYVAVDPSHRKDGLGTTLYRWFFRDLAAAGFDRCDAQVSSENVAALTLHRRFPFRFADVSGGYFLWLVPREVDAA